MWIFQQLKTLLNIKWKESLKSDIFHILYTEKEREASRECEYLKRDDIIKWIEYENKKAVTAVGFNKGDILRYKDRSTLYLVYDIHTRVSFGEYGWNPNDYVMAIIPVGSIVPPESTGCKE